MPLLNLFISKHRKVDFEVSILIRDLANVPLVSGLYYVKWRIRNASHASGMTERAPINDHSVFWNYPINTMAQLVINKQHVLGSCELKLEIIQELSGGKETHTVGTLSINLSEYAESGVTTRRYLLDDCKFNSTVKLSIRMSQKSDAGTQFQLPQPQKSMFSPQDMSTPDDRSIESVASERKLSSSSSAVASVAAATATANTTANAMVTPSPQLKKSQSAMSLPHFCKQTTPFGSTDEQSPTDLVEQLFMRKPAMNVQASS
ncbi:hypothetical protein LRAMOSA10395 [Lichtheimia ramosa]|uniref:C2 NT-type domain-containing protein n=1 Tax=Lichtheimia ramosa TaxID=688394 RepID=A0A077WNV0_9FUNG|nr:hypothetical protein LRAMOSA10395 [Lichtheimia ramosa]